MSVWFFIIMWRGSPDSSSRSITTGSCKDYYIDPFIGLKVKRVV